MCSFFFSLITMSVPCYCISPFLYVTCYYVSSVSVAVVYGRVSYSSHYKLVSRQNFNWTLRLLIIFDLWSGILVFNPIKLKKNIETRCINTKKVSPYSYSQGVQHLWAVLAVPLRETFIQTHAIYLHASTRGLVQSSFGLRSQALVLFCFPSCQHRLFFIQTHCFLWYIKFRSYEW